jgi:hypothetical protein
LIHSFSSFRGVEIVFENPIQISVESVVAKASRSRPRGVDVSIQLLVSTNGRDTFVISFSKRDITLIDIHLICTANSLHKVRVIAYATLAPEDRSALISSLAKLLKYIHVDPQILNTIL